MPVLVFQDTPPPINVNILQTNTGINVKKSSPSSPTMEDKSKVTELPEDSLTSRFPIAKMDTEAINSSLAARLASTLLGHVLFLKNQVPFPVLQLSRMPNGKSSTRATKQRQEMLASFDTICSHLDTTFSSLSTALAKCSSTKDEQTAQIYMAILVGPSISTAKSRVILGIDGLEKRIWGVRDETIPQLDEDSDNEGNSSDGEESVDEASEGLEHPDDSESEGEEEEEDVEDDDDGDDVDEEELDVEGEVEEEDTGSETSSASSVGCNATNTTTEQVQPTKSSPISISPPADYVSPAEQEKLLKNADRLLSRTLASADAAGHGFFSEISPTQTHVLIRAPRCFNHPSWIPRQNIASSLDTTLTDFINGSVPYQQDSIDEKSVNKNRSKNKTEGIWIATRHGIRATPPQVASHDDSSQEELDDMIWWSWDGKFVGFADW